MNPATRSAALVATTLMSLHAAASSQTNAVHEWRSYGGTPEATRFSPLDRINRDNVSGLARAWTYHTGELQLGIAAMPADRAMPFQTTPLVVDGVLYLSTPSSRVIALDAEAGKEIWTFDPQARATGPRRFSQHRGVAYWEGPAASGGSTDKRILYATLDARLYSLDAASGAPDSRFGEQGFVDLRRGVADGARGGSYSVSSPPAIYRDLVIVGARVPEGPSLGPSGNVRAFDVRTGALAWEFHTVPRPGEAGHDTWEGESWKGRTGVNVWGTISVDSRRGLVFLATGSPAYDFYGADRKGSNLFANSVVAVEAATGKRVWHFQTVHHDLWDLDLPTAPVLFDLQRGGRTVAGVAQVGKNGLVFLLDRETGKPLFPVEERPVPASEVPGEAAWPTQPFPAKPLPLSRHGAITRDDITDVTEESRRDCLALFDTLRPASIYTPLGLKPTLLFPGTLGGATWSGAAFDPGSGYLFVNSNNIGTFGEMRPQPPGASSPYRRGSAAGEYARFWDERRWPCQKPPWGLLTAVDLHTGDVAWQVPLGIVDELAAKGIANTGALNLGGAIVTAGGLVFIGGTNDERFRAFDSRTGRVLWETRLAASAHAVPITYAGRRSGRQFVVVAAGGGGYFSRKVSDEVVAFALK